MSLLCLCAQLLPTWIGLGALQRETAAGSWCRSSPPCWGMTCTAALQNSTPKQSGSAGASICLLSSVPARRHSSSQARPRRPAWSSCEAQPSIVPSQTAARTRTLVGCCSLSTTSTSGTTRKSGRLTCQISSAASAATSTWTRPWARPATCGGASASALHYLLAGSPSPCPTLSPCSDSPAPSASPQTTGELTCQGGSSLLWSGAARSGSTHSSATTWRARPPTGPLTRLLPARRRRPTAAGLWPRRPRDAEPAQLHRPGRAG